MELKVISLLLVFFKKKVSNSPCGVESFTSLALPTEEAAFLIHRVELKAPLALSKHQRSSLFLIHRVELKALSSHTIHLTFHPVSNSPCGVESFLLLGL